VRRVEWHRLQRRSLLDALATSMRGAGFDFPDGHDGGSRERSLAAQVSLYRDHDAAERATLHQVCEVFLDHDETVALWRHHHALMASREIGIRQGTGGSLGVAYLQITLDRHFFPDLWEVRNRL
jgi:tryptophan 2,3-dioxygenase